MPPRKSASVLGSLGLTCLGQNDNLWGCCELAIYRLFSDSNLKCLRYAETHPCAIPGATKGVYDLLRNHGDIFTSRRRLRRLSLRLLLRLRPSGDAWSWAELQAPRQSIRPTTYSLRTASGRGHRNQRRCVRNEYVVGRIDWRGACNSA